MHNTIPQPILNGRDSVQKVLDTFRDKGGHLGDIVLQVGF